MGIQDRTAGGSCGTPVPPSESSNCSIIRPVQVASSVTRWEKTALTRWGRYLTEIERCALLSGCLLAGQPDTAMEIGCDGGRWSTLLAEQGWTMICTDTREEVLEICRRRIPTARSIRVANTDTTLPGRTGIIKLLLCIEVDPVTHSDWFPGEAFRLLTRGGILIGTALNGFSWRGALHRAFVNIDPQARREYGTYTLRYRDWRKRFMQAGFKFVAEEGCCWFPFGRCSNSPLIPLCSRLERYLGLQRLPSVSPWVVFVAQKVGT